MGDPEMKALVEEELKAPRLTLETMVKLFRALGGVVGSGLAFRHS